MALTGLIYNTSKENDREQWRRSLAEAGLTLVAGSFEEGATVNSKTDAVWYIAGGQCYTWGGALPKDVPVKSTPNATGGISETTWIANTDGSLRKELASDNGASLSLSQIATAYSLDFSLGGNWDSGVISTSNNWWLYNNRVYKSFATVTLPSSPNFNDFYILEPDGSYSNEQFGMQLSPTVSRPS